MPSAPQGLRQALAKTLLAVVLLGAAVTQAAEPDGKLALPDLSALSAHASDSVDITLDPGLLSLASGFLKGDDPQDAAVREVIAGVKGIYVKSYTFERDFAYPLASIEAVRRQFGPNWQRVMQVHSGKDRSTVDIYICQVQGQARGLAIVATEPREFTLVNIVGAIDLQKLHKLEGHFGIPKLAQ